MNEKPKKFYWHANTSSGGTLSLDLNLEGKFSKKDKENILAGVINECYKHMEIKGFIPFNAKLMSSRDIADKYGKSRQYWEKLLDEGKILYKETSAGRITTDLWVQGYLGNTEQVNKYVRDVKKVLKIINELACKQGYWQRIDCPVCNQNTFEYAMNINGNVNGICRNTACSFHIHTTN